MQAILCDICKKKLEKFRDYTVPIYQYYDITLGPQNIKKDAMKISKPTSIDLCPECERKVADFFLTVGVYR